MFKIENLENIGVKIDLDLSNATPEELNAMGHLIYKEKVVVVDSQNLTDERVVEICDTIGKAYDLKYFLSHEKYGKITRVTSRRNENGQKIGMLGEGELGWHSDGDARPAAKKPCVALYCIVPGIGSITSWCDTKQAYEDLSEADKELCRNISFWSEFKNNTFYNLTDEDRELEIYSKYLPSEKPLVYTHPIDGSKGLNFPIHSIRRLISDREFDHEEFIATMTDHVFQEKYIYHHHWKPGDFTFSDQHHSLHKRNFVKGDRLLYRLALDYTNLT